MDTILFLGTSGAESAATSKKIYLSNQFALFFFSICLFFIFDHIVTGSTTVLMFDLVFTSVWIGVPLLNRSGFTHLSRVLIIANINILIFVFCCLLGPDQNVQFSLYAVAGLSLVLFESKDVASIIFGIALPVSAFFILDLTDFSLMAPWIGTARLDGGPVFFSNLAGFIGSLATVFYFFKASNSLITDIEVTESNLQEAQALATIGSWDWNIATNGFYCSKEMRRMLGPEEKQRIGLRDLLRKIEKMDRDRIVNVLRELIASPNSIQIEVSTIEAAGLRRVMFLQFKSVATSRNEISRLHGTVQDMTELRDAQKTIEDQKVKILATSKMSALGEMAAGMAHEINTPLGVIQLNAKQIRRFVQSPESNLEAIQLKSKAIETMAEHIAKIVQGLRSFARGGEQDPFESVDVQTLIEETMILSNARFQHHGIDLKLNNIPEDLKIEARRSQLSQVLLNLFNNAFDAVENAEEKWVTIEVRESMDRIEISVTDSGAGISKEIREKLMLPFFTTKEVGKGTGLGLSISQGIVKGHNGKLQLDTNSPHTSFTIDLPKHQVIHKEIAA